MLGARRIAGVAERLRHPTGSLLVFRVGHGIVLQRLDRIGPLRRLEIAIRQDFGERPIIGPQQGSVQKIGDGRGHLSELQLRLPHAGVGRLVVGRQFQNFFVLFRRRGPLRVGQGNPGEAGQRADIARLRC